MLRGKKLPMLVVLSSSIVFLIAATTGLIGYVSLQNGRRAVEDVARLLCGGPADLCRRQIGDGAADAVGDTPRDKALVFIEVGFCGEAIGAEGAGCGVGVCGRYQEVGLGHARLFFREAPRLGAQGLGQPEDVADDQPDARAAVVEHETAGPELVVDLFRWEWVKTTDDIFAEGGRYVARCGTRAELGRVAGFRTRRRRRAKKESKQQSGRMRCHARLHARGATGVKTEGGRSTRRKRSLPRHGNET